MEWGFDQHLLVGQKGDRGLMNVSLGSRQRSLDVSLSLSLLTLELGTT